MRFAQSTNERPLGAVAVAILLMCLIGSAGYGQSGSAKGANYLRKGQLSPRNREVLRAMGDRLETPGKERLVLTGALTLSAQPKSPSNVKITSEWPGLLRIDGVSGGAIVFNNGVISKANSPAGKQDEDLVNSFALDFVDHYLLGQSQGQTTRFLGPALVVNDPSIIKTVWDVVEMADATQLQGKPSQVTKLYGFNSRTTLLENVTYSLKVLNTETHMRVSFSNWQFIEQQRVPGNVTRVENGTSTFTFVLATAAVGPKVPDGAFDHP